MLFRYSLCPPEMLTWIYSVSVPTLDLSASILQDIQDTLWWTCVARLSPAPCCLLMLQTPTGIKKIQELLRNTYKNAQFFEQKDEIVRPLEFWLKMLFKTAKPAPNDALTYELHEHFIYCSVFNEVPCCCLCRILGVVYDEGHNVLSTTVSKPIKAKSKNVPEGLPIIQLFFNSAVASELLMLKEFQRRYSVISTGRFQLKVKLHLCKL